MTDQLKNTWWEQQLGGKNEVIENCGASREQIGGHIFLPISIAFYLPLSAKRRNSFISTVIHKGKIKEENPNKRGAVRPTPRRKTSGYEEIS